MARSARRASGSWPRSAPPRCPPRDAYSCSVSKLAPGFSLDRELGLRRHPAEYGVAPVSRRLLIRSGTMNRVCAVELAPVENNDPVDRTRDAPLGAQHPLD